MPVDPPESSIDLQFSVPYVHRLRVTQDVVGKDFEQLSSVLDDSGTGTNKVLVVGESAVAEASSAIAQRLSAGDNIELVSSPVIVDGGEEIKNSSFAVDDLLQRINETNLDRRSYLVAVGGGAMLDAVGFAAAIAHRGIRLIRLPTTTLAQADSGVGVKNAVNLFDKKNWIGSFAVPWAVINDTGLLRTLPDREFRSGFSEAVKVALLKDGDQFSWLCENAEAIRNRDHAISGRAIHHSCMLHLRHITQGGDPFEMLESRPLDFGHWSAHRLEPLSDYQVRHGEAVAIGVAIDCVYSAIKFGFPESDLQRVLSCFVSLGIPLWHSKVEPTESLMRGIEEFRQHLGGRLTITMLRGIGDPINVHEIDSSAMSEAIDRLKNQVTA